MEALLVTIVLPLTGGLMLLFDWQRQSGIDREARAFGARGLVILGWLALVQTGLVGVLLLRGLASPDLLAAERLLQAMVRLLIAGILAFTGRSALKVGRHDEVEALDLATQCRRASESERFRLTVVLLVALPMVLPIAVLGLIGIGLLWAGEAALSFSRACRTNRMLWALALASTRRSSLADEMELMAVRERRRSWQRRFTAMANALRDGTSLATALAAQPGLVPRPLMASIQTAEEAGLLAEVLPQLALRDTRRLDREEGMCRLSAIALSAWMVGLMLLGLSGFICYWIVPKMRQIFFDFNTELPPVTQQFVAATDWFSEHSILVIPLLGIMLLGLTGIQYAIHASNQGRGQLWVRIWPRLEISSILRTLADSVRYKVPLARTLELMSQMHPVDDHRARLARVQARVELGEPVGTALWDEGLLKEAEAHALRTAERLGQLEWTMQSLAEAIDRRRLERFNWLQEIVRPALVLVMAGAVLFFCVAMYSPVVELIRGFV